MTRKKTVIVACAVAALVVLPVVFWVSAPDGMVHIRDVGAAERIRLRAPASKVEISGIELRFAGTLNGTATITAANWTPNVVQGIVNRNVYHDWFDAECVIEYKPADVRAGDVSIEYRFR